MGREHKSGWIFGKSPILHRLAFELRYLYGYTFLDRCGRTMNAIMRVAPEWLPRDQTSPQNSPLLSLENNCVFNFSSIKMDFGLEQPEDVEIGTADVNQFVEQIQLVSQIVIDELGLTEFSRIGVRAWYLFRCQDKAESERWLRQLNLFTVSGTLSQAFGGEVESAALSVIIAGSDRKYRIGLNGAERSAKVDRGSDIVTINPRALSKNQDKILKEQLRRRGSLSAMPIHAVLIDFDAFQEDPISIDPRDFVLTSLKQFLPQLFSAVSAR